MVLDTQGVKTEAEEGGALTRVIVSTLEIPANKPLDPPKPSEEHPEPAELPRRYVDEPPGRVLRQQGQVTAVEDQGPEVEPRRGV